MIQTSQTTEKLDAALSKAQGEIETASKDKVNPHYKSRYSDLASVWEVIRGPISKYGINVTQWPIESTDNRLRLVTRVAYAGEWIMSTMSIPISKQDAHGYGSAITYCKRFALCAALGVSSEDDDGNAATGQKEEVKKEGAKNEVMASKKAPTLANAIGKAEQPKENTKGNNQTTQAADQLFEDFT
jgi:hypothetical protein